MIRLILVAILTGILFRFIYRWIDRLLSSWDKSPTEPAAGGQQPVERERHLVKAIEEYIQQGFAIVSAESTRAHLQRRGKLDTRTEVVDVRLEVDDTGQVHRWIERRPG